MNSHLTISMVVVESQDAFIRINQIATKRCLLQVLYKVQNIFFLNSVLGLILCPQGAKRVIDLDKHLELVCRVRTQVLVELNQTPREDYNNCTPAVRKPA